NLFFRNGLSLDHSTITVNMDSSLGIVPASGAGPQAISGIGEIVALGTAGSSVSPNSIGASNVTIGPGIIIRTGASNGALGAGLNVTCAENQGTISSQTGGMTISM